MQQFKLSASSIKKHARRPVVIAVPALLIILIAGLAPTYYEHHNEPDFDPSSIYITMGMVLVIYAGVTAWSVKWVKSLYESYTLTITDNTISREQRNTPTITMYHSEVTAITKGTNGSYLVAGQDKMNPIIVYAGMEEAAELETALNRIKPVTAMVPQTRSKLLLRVYMAALAVVLGCILFATNIYVVNGAKVLLLSVVAWAGVTIIKSKNTDKKLKFFGWFILIAFALGIINALIMWLAFDMTPFQQ